MKKSVSLFFTVAATVFSLAACSLFGGSTDVGGGTTVSLVSQISAGYGFGAWLSSDGSLRTWGDNYYNQLGDISGENQTRPISIDSPGPHMHWEAVAAGGYHAIAIAREDADRTLWGWGLNLSGQAGNWWLDDPVVGPHQIGVSKDWETVSAGEYHSAAIKKDGTLWTWGSNSYGELGYSGYYAAYPALVGDDDGWTAVSAGYDYTLGLNGTSLYAWGRNVWGQLGDGSTTNSSSPVYIGSGWREISAGYRQSAGIKTDGTLWTWGGYGLYAYLGDGTHTGSRSPKQIGTDDDWESVSVGGNFTIAAKMDGSLWVWGESTSGALGLGTSVLEVDEPTPTQSGSEWGRIRAGWDFCLGTEGGSLRSWGDNGYGQLGIGSHDDRFEPGPF